MNVQERVKSFGIKNIKKEHKLNGYSVIPPTGQTVEKPEEREKKSVSIKDEPRGDDWNGKNALTLPESGVARAHTPVKEQFAAPKNVFELNMQKASEDSEKNLERHQHIIGEKTEKQTDHPEDIPRTDDPLSPAFPLQANDSPFVLSPLTLYPPYRSMKPKTALDLVFDADKYAPDGRLRTVHCMPDVNKAYKEARQARYVRTRYKTELEKELSVDEMFNR